MDNEKIVDEMLKGINHSIDAKPKDEVIADFKLLINSIVHFVASQEPRIMDKSLEDKEVAKYFMIMIGKLAGEGMTAQAMPFLAKNFEKKIEGIKKLYPLIQKYASV